MSQIKTGDRVRIFQKVGSRIWAGRHGGMSSLLGHEGVVIDRYVQCGQEYAQVQTESDKARGFLGFTYETFCLTKVDPPINTKGDTVSKRIKSIKVVTVDDFDPDLSWLGKFTDRWETGAIDRQRFGDWEPREMRFFVQGNHWPHNPKNWEHVSDEEKAEVIAEYRTLKRADWCYALEDMRRLENFGKTWVTIGIRAKAQIVVRDTILNIGTAGLWGIESDSDDDYKTEIEIEELSNLKEILRELGFTDEMIDAVEVEWM